MATTLAKWKWSLWMKEKMQTRGISVEENLMIEEGLRFKRVKGV